MSTAIMSPPSSSEPVPPTPDAPPTIVALKRRTIDSILIAAGAVATLVLATSGGLLTWGHNFSSNYVHNELSAQHITFPTTAGLAAEGRSDLNAFAGQKLDSGDGAQAYASYINGHLTKIGAGATYADLGAPETAANAAVTAATAAGQSPADVAALQAKATAITNTRNTLFKGETLRGLLLSAYAWSTVGTIAGIAAIGAFIAAAIMAVLVGLGLIHHRRTPSVTPPAHG